MARHQIRTDLGTLELNLERVDAEVEGDKRQHAPYLLKWRCPCGAEQEDAFVCGEYFSRPVFGKAEAYTLWCAACQNEHAIKLKVDITVEVAVG